MKLLHRYCLFITGLFFMAFGICLIIKGCLGSSPISSVPYILSLNYTWSLGVFTFIINMLMLLAQILILKRHFKILQFLQIPMTMIFTFFIDMVMHILSFYTPEIYGMKLFITLLGSLSLGFGVALQVIGNVVMLPGEGLVYAIATHWNYEFGKTKTFFDSGLVVIAALLSLYFTSTIEGLREGTVISALIVGSIARFFIHKLSIIDKYGRISLWFIK